MTTTINRSSFFDFNESIDDLNKKSKSLKNNLQEEIKALNKKIKDLEESINLNREAIKANLQLNSSKKKKNSNKNIIGIPKSLKLIIEQMIDENSIALQKLNKSMNKRNIAQSKVIKN